MFTSHSETAWLRTMGVNNEFQSSFANFFQLLQKKKVPLFFSSRNLFRLWNSMFDNRGPFLPANSAIPSIIPWFQKSSAPPVLTAGAPKPYSSGIFSRSKSFSNPILICQATNTLCSLALAKQAATVLLSGGWQAIMRVSQAKQLQLWAFKETA